MKRPALRFRLSTLFVLVTIVASGLGWFAYREYLYRREFVEVEVTKVTRKAPGEFFNHIVRYQGVAGGALSVVRRIEDPAGVLEREETILTRSIEASADATLSLRFRFSRGRFEVINMDPNAAQVILDLAPKYDPQNNYITGGPGIPIHTVRRGEDDEVARLLFHEGVADDEGRPIRDNYYVYLRVE